MPRQSLPSLQARITRLVRPLYGFSDLREIGRHLADAIGRIVAHDSVVFCEAQAGPAPRSTYHAHPFGGELERYGPVMDRCFRQNPFVRHYAKHPLGPAVRTFDLVGAGEWERTELWNGGLKPLGLNEQIGAHIPAPAGIVRGFLTNRETRSFTTRDTDTLELVRAHIASAASAADQWRRHDQGLSPGGSATAVLSPDARVLLRSPEAAALLATAAGPSRAALPEIVTRWARREIDRHRSPDLWAHARSALTLGTGSAALTLRLVSPPDGTCHLLLIERIAAASPVALLSARERQILDWIARGKTNGEIAVILGISLHTVKNHVKHILFRLGVENRTSAALLLREQRG